MGALIPSFLRATIFETLKVQKTRMMKVLIKSIYSIHFFDDCPKTNITSFCVDPFPEWVRVDA
jgi:hypothetical protein